MYWNARSIQNKIIELYEFLTEKDIHIACLSETHLKPNQNIHSHPDYSILRLDRTTRNGGGVAIVIRKSLKYRLLPDLDMNILETIGIEIVLENGSKIKIYSSYLPGSCSSILINRHFIRDLRLVTETDRNDTYFFCGDLNARHRNFNSLSTNTAGRLLYNEYINSDFVVALPNSPTYIPSDPSRNPSTIDLMITNSLVQFSDPICEYVGSDHNAVCVTIHLTTPTILNNERTVRAFNRTNWVNYQRAVIRRISDIETNIDDITTTVQIDHHVELLTKAISEARDCTVPLVRRNEYRLQITPEITNLILVRRNIRRLWQRHRIPSLKTEVNALTRRIRYEIQMLRNDNWSHRLQHLPQDDNKKSLWQITKFLKNRNRAIPPIKENDRVLITPEEKMEALANKFEEFHNNPLANNDPQSAATINSSVNDYLANETNVDPRYPTVEETLTYVKQLKNAKAPGYDRINNTLLKKLPPQAIFYLNFIICCCLKLCYFPSKWKTATVVPIRKPGKDASLTSSYRPISLLCSLSKILERVILSRLNAHTELHNILPTTQHGFRPFHSTTHQLHRVTTILRQNLNLKRTTGMILFDIEKAFDRIWHAALIYKLMHFGYPTYIVRLIKSFITQRKFQVTVNNKTSTIRSIPFGVPQGAVLSPSLYNIYTSDAPTFPNCTLAYYADDTALISSLLTWRATERALTTATHEFYAYYNKWKINLNASKTQALLITRKRLRNIPHQPFQLNNQEIQWENQAKYLGFTIDKTLTMKYHVENIMNKTQNAIKILYPLIHRRSTLNTENKMLLFKTALRPIYAYASPILTTIANTHINKLQIMQNKILKMILNLPWYTPTALLHEQNNIELVKDFITRLKEKFIISQQFLEGETN